MINKFVIANLKMNLTTKEISSYLKIINNKMFVSNVVICPTSIYIPYFLNHSYDVGIQNVYCEDLGSFTGEVSPLQASSMGIKYAIIGHSDRRIMGEDDNLINKKIKMAIKNKLKVVFCIGETAEERGMLKTDKVLKQQIVRGLRGLKRLDLQQVLIAYEPVWAVGTNELPSNREISDFIAFIKDICKKNLEFVPFILYGGSINEKNIKNLMRIDNVDGFLIGSSSCEPDKLIKIIDIVDNMKV